MNKIQPGTFLPKKITGFIFFVKFYSGEKKHPGSNPIRKLFFLNK